jgi:hypothetical protein
MAPRKKVTSERKKYCRCSTKCNKKLLRTTRRHHYKKIPKNRQHLIRASESCSDADLESHSALSPLNQGTGTVRTAPFDVPELMDSDASGSSGGGEGGEAFPDELMEESEGDYEGDYGMGQVSGSEGDDVGPGGVLNYSEDLDSDNETKISGFGDSENLDSEFDDWKAFDEDEELEAERSDDEALREFEEMMGDEEYAELWSTRRYSLCHVLPLFNNIFSHRR